MPLSSGIIVVREVRPFEIVCYPPKAIPPARIWWEDESGRTLSTLETTRSLLFFESPRVDVDNGNYTCRAENLAGIKNITIQVLVSGKVLPYYFI